MTRAADRASIGPRNRNAVINGAMDIAQRGASFTAPATAAYTLDRWRVGHSLGTGVVDILQATDGPTTVGLSTFPRCLHADVTTAEAAIAAGEFYAIQTKIEGYRTYPLGVGAGVSGKSMTLSFYVKSTKTGTFCVAFMNNAGNRSYVAEYTVDSSDTWEYKTITLDADSTGTWETTTSTGMWVMFSLATGSTFQTTAGSWQAGQYFGSSNQVNALDSTSNNFKITGVQLEAGPGATEFDVRGAGEELALCHRYFVRMSGGGTYIQGNLGAVQATTLIHGPRIEFPAVMRTIPTVTDSGWTWGSGGTGNIVAFYNFNFAGWNPIVGALTSTCNMDHNGCIWYFAAGTSFTSAVVGDVGSLYFGDTSYFDASAEL